MRGKVDGAGLLEWQMRSVGLSFEREYRFHPVRKWRADFAFPERKVLVEFEGVTFFGKNKDGSMKLGRHQTARGYVADLEKYNAAALLGYRVLRFSIKMVKSGEALRAIEEALAA